MSKLSKIVEQLQNRNRYLLFLDLVLLPVAVGISFLLRLDNFDPVQFGAGYLFFTLLALVVTPITYYAFGIYSRYWPFASIDEMVLLISASTTAGLAIAVLSWIAIWLFAAAGTLPRSIPFIFFPVELALTAGPRFIIRLLARYQRQQLNAKRVNGKKARLPKNVLIVGAGYVGVMLAREIRNNPDLALEPVGFIDDDPRKLYNYIQGIPIIGGRNALRHAVQEYKVAQVIIAMPNASGKIIREIAGACEQMGVEARIIPGMYAILDETVSINQLRKVEIEDLLRREPVQTDIAAVRELLTGKRVLITGGGGSIGGELCRQVLRCGPTELIVLGHGENSIFEICNELQRKLDLEAKHRALQGVSVLPPMIHPVIADIRFADRVQAVFQQYRPEIVFHAAAHKHVPLMECNPTEAVSNNILGTRNLLEASVACGVDRFVMISTDKAVNPTSIMGATKRVAEMLVQQTAAQVGKAYVAVRFGNVLGSRGSVVLTFKQQIAAGGPVTVTDPDMVRFFMTIPEAVQLVLQAAVLGHGGEVFMLDMGEPVKIVDLARDLIELSGLQVGRDIDIVYTGIRPGEKLFEELFISGEVYQHTGHEKIFALGHLPEPAELQLEAAIDRLESSIRCNDVAALIAALKDLMPDFRTSSALAVDETALSR